MVGKQAISQRPKLLQARTKLDAWHDKQLRQLLYEAMKENFQNLKSIVGML